MFDEIRSDALETNSDDRTDSTYVKDAFVLRRTNRKFNANDGNDGLANKMNRYASNGWLKLVDRTKQYNRDTTSYFMRVIYVQRS